MLLCDVLLGTFPCLAWRLPPWVFGDPDDAVMELDGLGFTATILSRRQVTQTNRLRQEILARQTRMVDDRLDQEALAGLTRDNQSTAQALTWMRRNPEPKVSRGHAEAHG